MNDPADPTPPDALHHGTQAGRRLSRLLPLREADIQRCMAGKGHDMACETPSSASDSLPAAAQLASTLPTAPPAARSNRRRRLWQLPPQAHELLVAVSFTPEWLRRETARTLGQIHKGQCVLQGRDVDLLYHVVHDLVTRNPLSEAMHRHLDTRNALALRAMAAAKDEQALQAAWAQGLADEAPPAAVPATLWAVLTHPLGEAVQSAVLCDARAWVFAQARRNIAQSVSRQRTEAQVLQARQRADDLQGRLVLHQQQSAEALRAAQADVARLQGELARRQATVCENQAPEARGGMPHPEPIAARVRKRACDRAPAGTTPPQPTAALARSPAPTPVPGPAVQPSAVLDVAGRHVLCVGGIQHAVARYRGRIETLGGRFEHHDGGIEDSVQALDARLGRADVVICQAACINHEAYHRVKRHCERTGTPCVYLDRPSLSRLDRALARGQGTRLASR